MQGGDEVHECTAAATIYSLAICSFYTIVHHLLVLAEHLYFIHIFIYVYIAAYLYIYMKVL